MKRKYDVLILVLFLQLCFVFPYSNHLYFINSNDLHLKSSDNEIVISTPENKTYTEPMGGYYPATFGFENDKVGEDPQEWTVGHEYDNIEIQVIDSVDGHNRVVEINDQNNTDGYPGILYYPESTYSYGTFEFWMRFDSITDGIGITSRETSSNIIMINVIVEGGKWKYYIGASTYGIPNVNDPVINTWQHIRFDFRCHNAPAYASLSDDRFIITIDGISSGELQHRNSGYTDYNYIKIGSGVPAQAKTWIDAVGFSWDTNYNLGDNLDDGLLLGFEKSAPLDWIGYSLDGQSNKTILGNTTISFPSEGSHNIQVFGNNSFGIMFASNLRYFSIDTEEPIIPPEIPGYNIIFLLLGLCWISIVIYMKKFKKIKN